MGFIGLGSIQMDHRKNIAADTWEASMLYRQIHFPGEKEWLGFTGLLDDSNGNSFTSERDIEFLITKSLNDSIPMVERRQSLSYLQSACRKVYEHNHPIPGSKKLQKQKLKQKSIRDQILPLLEDQNLKSFAFPVVSVLSDPGDGNLKHRIDLEALPTIINHYKEEEQSDYKSDLAQFITDNSNEEEWKKLSNCDKNIFVDLYQVHIDTIQNKLTFGINYDYGKEPINDPPFIVIKNSTTDEIIFHKQYSEFKLPYYNWNGVSYLSVDLKGFKEANYKVYTKGKAGKQSQYSWVSEYGEFTIE